MFLLNGKILQLDAPFECNGNQYPANWLRLTSLQEKQAIGITEVPDPIRPDDRYYWVTQNSDGTFSTTPKDLDELKKNTIKQINDAAYSMLQTSDWMYVRELETGVPMSNSWKQWRASIRTTASDAANNVSVCTTVENLISLPSISWERAPNSII